MDMLIPDSWIKDYLKTSSTPKQIADYLSLCSQSVEKVIKLGNDSIYEIEITANRPDCLSIYGIARELSVILPKFGISAALKKIKAKYDILPIIKNSLPVEIIINNKSLCPRFTAIILDNIKIKPSPKIISERLEKCKIRSINNIVDISNYLMLELGQPMHTFDYDKIGKNKMILRESQKGEKITTLDGQKRFLPRGTIIIEDGDKKKIDLCGIMGGENSRVDNNTKRVLLFVQTYDRAIIRKTCQELAFRTEAAARFEKGVDPEGVKEAIIKAIGLFEKNCDAKIASNLIDIYPNPPKEKTINLDLGLVKKIIGIEIPKNEVIKILKSLGFSILKCKLSIVNCIVPHWRYDDISIPEDLIEEIARIYGYHNLPANLLPTLYNVITNKNYIWLERLKKALKYWGYTEVASYSMISNDLLEKVKIVPDTCVKISNPLTNDLVYMRPSLIPSILEIISQNLPNYNEINIFEIAKVYTSQENNSLPNETENLIIASSKDNFFEIKGIAERIMEDFGIKYFELIPENKNNRLFAPKKTLSMILNGESIGYMGELNQNITNNFKINKKINLLILETGKLIENASTSKKYHPINQFPPSIEDLAFIIQEKTLLGTLIDTIKKIDPLIFDAKLLDIHNNTRTIRITYQSDKKTLNSEDISKIRQKIIEYLDKKFKVKLKI